ncbi:hypothetical protein ACFVMC_20460 [Nocardia sp. NPDC127579]|uniref:hypothetical protein n=1 Tax=Nocardia sp. NPDC127579 TaxID=3345402 RepID=UPI0036424483
MEIRAVHKIGAAASIAVVLATAFNPASAAAEVGSRVPGILPDGAMSFLGDLKRDRCTLRASASVVVAENAVYVADLCDDGQAVVSNVTWKDGSVQSFSCSNPYGVQTMVKCSLGNSKPGQRTMVVGLSEPVGGGQPQWGSFVHYNV